MVESLQMRINSKVKSLFLREKKNLFEKHRLRMR